jgi:hypothetical protein
MTYATSTGYFEVHNLNPGVCSISVTAPGFAQSPRKGITLEADARVNVPLQVRVLLQVPPGQSVQDELVERHNQLVVGRKPTAALTPMSGPANSAYATTPAAATPAELVVLPRTDDRFPQAGAHWLSIQDRLRL